MREAATVRYKLRAFFSPPIEMTALIPLGAIGLFTEEGARPSTVNGGGSAVGTRRDWALCAKLNNPRADSRFGSGGAWWSGVSNQERFANFSDLGFVAQMVLILSLSKDEDRGC
jgi:hypothetical protein